MKTSHFNNNNDNNRTLREKQHKANFEFIKDQRIHCLLEGSWFRIVNLKDRKKARGLMRFCRLSSNMKNLLYADLPFSSNHVPKLSELTERIEISSISTIKKTPYHSESNDESVFTLVSHDTESLIELGPLNETNYAEWTDGLAILIGQYFTH